MNRISHFALPPILLLSVVSQAATQPIDNRANINLYVTPADYTGCNSIDDADLATCQNLTSPPNLGDSYLWVVTSHEDGFPNGIGGIGGIEFGIVWQGLDILTWAMCTGGLQIPQTEPIAWPASGTGNAITWSGGCYVPPVDVAKVGFFTISDGNSGSIAITGDPRLNPPQALYTTCFPEETLHGYCSGNLGFANLAMGTDPLCGDNCGPTPTVEVSWSAIKARFDR